MKLTTSPTDPCSNVTVMASAGTGKTWLLVTRLVRLLLEGTAPDAILAISFTRKAAAEIQARLGERLLALAAADEAQLDQRLREMHIPADARHRQRARELYEQLLRSRRPVRTATFHAFCQDVLRRFPLEADVPPGFELLEREGELLAMAHDALVAEATAEPKGALAGDLEQLLDYCGGLDGLRGALDSFIQHRSDWWAFTEPAADALEYACQALREQLGVGEGDDGGDPLAAFFGPGRDGQLTEFAELLGRHPTQANTSHRALLGDARDEVLTDSERFARVREVFLTASGSVRSRKDSAALRKKMGDDGGERFLALHRQLSEAVLEALDALANLASYRATTAWYRAGLRLLGHYQRIKQEQRLLDFADLEWKAYRLLNQADNAHWVQYKLDQRIDHLLVDEFQDTNPTQWRLLLPLLQEMAAGESERRRSVFLVGDAKQSIYRFRRAEPRLFGAAAQWLERHMAAERHSLDTSWRSSPAIMRCVNAAFESPALLGVLQEFQPHATHHDALWGRVELFPLHEPAEIAADEAGLTGLRNPLLLPRPESVDERYLNEGRQIAATIRQLVDSGTLLGAEEAARPAHYGDIMVLVRSRTHVQFYEAALREAQIPYVGADRGTLLESQEAQDMVALLESLITPYNNLSLAAVLRSPLFACSDDELLRLAQAGKGHWYARLERLVDNESAEGPLARAARLLGEWRAVAGILPIHDLLDRIYRQGDVMTRYHSAYPGHLRSRVHANLTRFLELALEIDSGRYPSLSHFLARLAQLRASANEAPDEAPAGAGERVRIMTIHAAKGLEAPVVFLADATHSGNSRNAYRAFCHWPASAERPQLMVLRGRKEQHPQRLRELLEEEAREEQREAANLLYVAITRARQLLYVSGCAPTRGSELGWYGQLRTALDPLEEAAPDDSVVLEHRAAPTINRQLEPSPVAAVEVDPALARPLSVVEPYGEIAPSSRVTHSFSNQGDMDEDARRRGVAIHYLLEKALTSPTRSLPEHLAHVAGRWGVVPDSAEAQGWLREAEQVLSHPELAPLLREQAGVRGYCEVPVQYRHDGQTVYGIIDRLLVTDDEVWLVDYKTHRSASAENLAELAEPYREQLQLYAGALARLWPRHRLRASLLFTAMPVLYDMRLEK